jgi:adenosine deaminase
MTSIQVLRAVDRGLRKAQTEFNRRPSVAKGEEPEFHYGMIVCAMRMFNQHFSEYFKTIVNAHRHAPKKELFSLASLELARAAVEARDVYGLPVVGFDLAGEEAG